MIIVNSELFAWISVSWFWLALIKLEGHWEHYIAKINSLKKEDNLIQVPVLYLIPVNL